MQLPRTVPLLLTLVVITASCGGGGTLFDTTTTSAAPGVEALLGPEPALVAVGYALDRGYTAAQIPDGA